MSARGSRSRDRRSPWRPPAEEDRVRAICVTGTGRNLRQVAEMVGEERIGRADRRGPTILTSEGWRVARPGYWVVKDGAALRVLSESAFAAEYERVAT